MRARYTSYQRTIRETKHYGVFNFLFDCFMLCITFGFWGVWIFCREMRNR